MEWFTSLRGPRWPPLSVFCTVAVGAHGLSPCQGRDVPQKPSSAAELLGQSVPGEVFALPGAAQGIRGTGQAAAGSITSPPLPESTAWTVGI